MADLEEEGENLIEDDGHGGAELITAAAAAAQEASYS